MKTADQAAKNWLAGMQAPLTAQKYKDGINSYTGNPMALAAAAVQNGSYLAGIQRALNSGRMVNKLNAANPATWKQNSINIGAPRLSSGATKGQPKYVAAVAKLAPVWQQMHDAAHALPRGGLANATARANAALAILMNYAGTA